MPTRVHLVVLLLVLLCSTTVADARAAAMPLVRGSAALHAPASGVTVTAPVRRCQRGKRLALRVGVRRLTTRLPRRGALRRTWSLQRPAGRVRWRHAVRGAGRGCARRLGAGTLRFATAATRRPLHAPAAPPAVAAPVPPAPPRTPVQFGTAIAWAAMQDPAYAAMAARFGSWTPENEMKMEALAPRGLLTIPQYDFEVADALVSRAAAEGRRVHGHALVFKHQIPKWVRTAPFTTDGLRAYLTNYISTVVGRYRGRVQSWDVVNEPLLVDGSLDRSTFWASRLGDRYIADAFRAARAADPDATLYLNEVLDVQNPIAEGTYALVRDLRAQGVPIDAVGLQTHVQAGQSVLTEEAFHAIYARFAELGVKVAVTEMDVETSSPAEEALQAQVFANAARACARVPACERFAVWGVTDRYSWLGPDKAGLPIDRDFRLKPAWTAIAGALGLAP